MALLMRICFRSIACTLCLPLRISKSIMMTLIHSGRVLSWCGWRLLYLFLCRHRHYRYSLRSFICIPILVPRWSVPCCCVDAIGIYWNLYLPAGGFPRRLAATATGLLCPYVNSCFQRHFPPCISQPGWILYLLSDTIRCWYVLFQCPIFEAQNCRKLDTLFCLFWGKEAQIRSSWQYLTATI